MNLALNDPQWLICHKKQTKPSLAQLVGAVEYTDCTSANG